MPELLLAMNDEKATARFVRFLIAEGVIPAPRGGRANADYGDDHVSGIRRYLQLRDLGLSATRTKEIVSGSAAGAVPVPIAPGLTLFIEPEKIVGSPSPQEIAAKILQAFELIKREDH